MSLIFFSCMRNVLYDVWFWEFLLITDVHLLEHFFVMNSTNLVLSFNGKAIDFTDEVPETDEEGKKVGL